MQPYYERSGITIYHADCRELLPSLDADGLLLTDPPYGCAYATNHTVRGVGASWLNTRITGDDSTALRDWALQCWDTRPAMVFGSWRLPRPARTRGVLIWDKGPASGMGDLSFPWKCSWEEIYILGPGFAGSRDEGVLKGFSMVTWESKGRTHPTEKPITLLRYLLTKHPAALTVDPFMGSGTTLRAAKDLGRRAIGIEIEERYCQIAAQRLEQEVFDLSA